MDAFPNYPVRLAVLEADISTLGIMTTYSSYGGVITHLFERACVLLTPPKSLQLMLAILTYNVVGDSAVYPDLDHVDAILITGSRYSATDSDAWITRLVDFIRKTLDGGRVRVIGICFSHQVVGRAIGAKVERNVRGWELSIVEHELTDEGTRLFGLDTMSIQHMHCDVIAEYPPGVIPLARTSACDTQAMYLPGRMISVQGHPEYTEEMVRGIMGWFEENSILSDDILSESLRRVGGRDDGVEVAKTFLRFLS